MEDNNELTIYILQQLRQGVPEQAIRQILAQNGWPQALVDRAFTMVMQARPHQVEPQLAQTLPPTQPKDAELPAPSEQNVPVLEGEKKREKRSRLRKFLLFFVTLLVLTGIGAAVYFFVIKDDATKQATDDKPAPISADEGRKEVANRLASELLDYYKETGTYPTFAQITSSEFASLSGGFDATTFKDPKWDAKKAACVRDDKPILTETRSEDCLTYRATALNGGDCDANETKCTRIVITATLDGNKPFVVALDQNRRE